MNNSNFLLKSYRFLGEQKTFKLFEQQKNLQNLLNKGEVLFKVKSISLCGGDIFAVYNRKDLTSFHSTVIGEVVSTFDDDTKKFIPGDKIVKLKGFSSFSNYMVAHENNILRIDKELNLENAFDILPSTSAFTMIKNHVTNNNIEKIIQSDPCYAVGYYINQICKLNNISLINVVPKRDFKLTQFLSELNKYSNNICNSEFDNDLFFDKNKDLLRSCSLMFHHFNPRLRRLKHLSHKSIRLMSDKSRIISYNHHANDDKPLAQEAYKRKIPIIASEPNVPYQTAYLQTKKFKDTLSTVTELFNKKDLISPKPKMHSIHDLPSLVKDRTYSTLNEKIVLDCKF